MAEDRRIEPEAQLLAIVGNSDVYGAFMQLCRKADAGYNSGLFDFESDRLTPKLALDSKVLKGIIEQLYYPKSDYEFRFFPHDLLGSVYERFLGSVIRLSASRAHIEEKPEVKKAGGVYYTPGYIVDYIVEQTAGKLLDEISGSRRRQSAQTSDPSAPDEDQRGLTSTATLTDFAQRTAALRRLDPACGSGPFPIPAFYRACDTRPTERDH